MKSADIASQHDCIYLKRYKEEIMYVLYIIDECHEKNVNIKYKIIDLLLDVHQKLIVTFSLMHQAQAAQNEFDAFMNFYNIFSKNNTYSPHLSSALFGIGQAYSLIENYNIALTYLLQALDESYIYHYKSGERFTANIPKILNTIAHIYDVLGQYTNALKYYDESLTENELFLDENIIAFSHTMAITFLGRGWVNFALGNYSAALFDFNQSLKKRLELHNGDREKLHPYLLIAFGYAHLAQESYQESLVACNEALNLSVAQSVANLVTAAAYLCRGEVYAAKGYSEISLNDFESAISLLNGTQSNHTEAIILKEIGKNHYNRGDYSTALFHYDISLAMRYKILGEIVSHIHIADLLHAQGEVHQALCCYFDAEEYYQKALAMYYQITLINNITNHPGLEATSHVLGDLYFEWGNITYAKYYYEKAITMGHALHGKQAFTTRLQVSKTQLWRINNNISISELWTKNNYYHFFSDNKNLCSHNLVFSTSKEVSKLPLLADSLSL